MEASAITSAASEIFSMITTHVLPMATSKPFVYYLAIGIVTACVGVIAGVKHAVK